MQYYLRLKSPSNCDTSASWKDLIIIFLKLALTSVLQYRASFLRILKLYLKRRPNLLMGISKIAFVEILTEEAF